MDYLSYVSFPFESTPTIIRIFKIVKFNSVILLMDQSEANEAKIRRHVIAME